jgi:hypothetical protein
MNDKTAAELEVLEKHEMARCKLFSRSGKYKILPYGFALAKNSLGEGATRNEAWENARDNLRGVSVP